VSHFFAVKTKLSAADASTQCVHNLTDLLWKRHLREKLKDVNGNLHNRRFRAG